MAAKVGYKEKAYDYFMESARLDLDNTHGNTKDGLHMANMGGTWMSIIHGFGGVRIKETGLSLSPSLPSQWSHYEFTLFYLQRKISVKVNKEDVTLILLEGQDLKVKLFNDELSLNKGKDKTVKISN